MMYTIKENNRVLYELTWCRKRLNGNVEIKSFTFDTYNDAIAYWDGCPVGNELPFYMAKIDKITQYSFTKYFDRETIFEESSSIVGVEK